MPEANKPAAVWLVEFPTFRYVEDVKSLARRAGLTIIDAAEASDEDRAAAVSPKDAPKLTVKPEYKPARVKAEKPTDPAGDQVGDTNEKPTS